PDNVEGALKKGSMEKIAKDLGVNLVVHGAVQGGGDKVRILIQVDDVKKGKRVWEKEYPRLRQDVLTAQNSIYSDLVAALDLQATDDDLTRGALRLTGNYGAYELYQKARDVVRRQPDP